MKIEYKEIFNLKVMLDKAKLYYYGTEIKNVKSFSFDYSGIDININ